MSDRDDKIIPENMHLHERGSAHGKGKALSGKDDTWDDFLACPADLTDKPASKKPTVVVAHVHELLRQGLCAMLKPIARVVGQAESGEDAVSMTRDRQPELVIIDSTFRDMNGMETCKQICTYAPGVNIILFADVYHATKHFHQPKRAGARCFCLQASGPRCFYEAFRHASLGEAFCDPTLQSFIAQKPERAKHLHLTNEEIEVWIRLDLKNSLISEELKIKLTTVERRIESLLTQLGASTRTAAALAATQHGYVLLPVFPTHKANEDKSDELLLAERVAQAAINKWGT